MAAEHPFAVGGYVDSLYEHVKAKHRKMWDQALKTYNLAPDPTTARGIAAWLVRFCGRNSSRLAVIIGLIVNGDLDNFMMQLDSIIPKLNQEQWDRIAPLFTDFEKQKNLRYATHKYKDKLKANGVTPWYPPTRNPQYENRPAEIAAEVDYFLSGEVFSLALRSFMSNAFLYLTQEQWDQLIPLVTDQGDKKDISKLIEIWEPEIKATGLNPQIPWKN